MRPAIDRRERRRDETETDGCDAVLDDEESTERSTGAPYTSWYSDEPTSRRASPEVVSEADSPGCSSFLGEHVLLRALCGVWSSGARRTIKACR